MPARATRESLLSIPAAPAENGMMLTVGPVTTLVGAKAPVPVAPPIAAVVALVMPAGEKANDEECVAPTASAVALPLGVMVLTVGYGAA